MGVASDNVFYVVNPDGNLPETQTRLDKAFQEYQQWEGVTGKEPAKDVLERVLQDKDAYMFCGHGSGTKFISGDEVRIFFYGFCNPYFCFKGGEAASACSAIASWLQFWSTGSSWAQS